MLFNERTVICTPKKTGSTSLQAALVRSGWCYTSPQHRRDWAGPQEDRVLIVRDPYKRLESMFDFAGTCSDAGKSCWLSAYADDPDQWATLFLHYREHPGTKYTPDWTLGLWEHAQVFKPTRVIKLEELDAVRDFGAVRPMGRSNASRRRGRLLDVVDAGLRDELLEWCDDDADAFGYPRRPR